MKYQLTKVYKLSEMPVNIQKYLAYEETDYYGYDVAYRDAEFEKLIPYDYIVVEYERNKHVVDYLLANGAEINEKVIIDLVN